MSELTGDRIVVPPTKLWNVADPRDAPSYIIMIGCECGNAVDYPGHPDERTEVQCESCGTIFKVRE